MAAVNERQRASDRAQLLLVGAFVLAIALIGLTLVLNANTYTATVATDGGPTVNGGDTVTTQQSVERHFRGLLTRANDRETGHADQVAYVRESAPGISKGVRDYRARRGRFANATVDGGENFENGTRIYQTGGSFPGSPFSIADPIRVRDPTLNLTTVPDTGDGQFELNLTRGGDYWGLYVYKDDTAPGNPVVVGTQPTGGESRECRFDYSDYVAINIADATVTTVDGSGTVQERHCPVLERFGRGFDGYDVTFTPSAAEGEFSMVVNETSFSSINGNSEEYIYDASVAFRYRSAAVTYETTLRVAPGEIP